MPNHDRFECQTAIDSDAILQDDDFYANNGIATDDIVGVGLVYQF